MVLLPDAAQVLVVITRWRTEANEARERAGLAKVYLLEHKAAEQEANVAKATAHISDEVLRKYRAAE